MIGRMLRFLTHFVIGIFAILGVFVAIVMAAAGLFLYRSMEAPTAPAPALVLTATLEGPAPETAGPDPVMAFLQGGTGSFGSFVDGLDIAAADPRVKGVLLDVGRSELGMAQAEELRQALRRFRRTGRFAIAFADSFGEMEPATVPYYLATACDEIWVQPIGLIGLSGIGIESYFAKDALDRLGVSLDMRTRRNYKTAADSFTKSAMTAENREMLESLAADLSATLMGDIAEARQIPPEKLAELVADAPLSAEKGLDAHLIDGIAHSETVIEDALSRAGPDADSMDLADYLAENTPPRTKEQKTIALIHATGEIRRGADGMDPFAGETLSASDIVAADIMDATDDETVAAIVVRVDSPGGSAVASETVRAAILRARSLRIPVVVSMGDVAASGGYWISMDADRILAQNTTLTGSIGVLAGKPVIKDLMARLGITWEGVSGPGNALMWTPARPFTESESARMDALLDDIYEQFKQRVGHARGLPPEAVEALAQGRVWTGRQALERRLIDGIGGLHEAWLAAREAAGISRQENVPLVPYARKDGLLDHVRRLLAGMRLWGVEGSRIRALAADFATPSGARMPVVRPTR